MIPLLTTKLSCWTCFSISLLFCKIKNKLLIKIFNFIKNLENYGVLEMNAKEIRATEGGFFGLDDLLIGVTLLVVGGIIDDWDNFKTGISGNY